MRVIIIILFCCVLGLLVNSCKKDDQTYTKTLLTSAPWVLASVQTLRYTGSNLTETDTLNTKCKLKQTFTFNNSGSCTYDNFICRQSTATGDWKFSDDNLTLIAGLMLKDTLDGGRDTTNAPFKNARVVNLGSYSLVLETGDINAYFTSNTRRIIKRYGFVHE